MRSNRARAAALSAKRRRQRRLAGDPVMVPTAEVVAHVRRLMAWGLPVQSVSQAAGLPRATLKPIMAGRYRRTHTEIAEAVLAVDHRPHPAQMSVLAIGARRRVQALAARGWPMRCVAERLGMDTADLCAMIKQRAIKRARWEQIAAVYEELWLAPGPSEITARRAAKAGWPPPAAWDDELIDHPQARPAGYATVHPLLDEIDQVRVDRLLAGRTAVAGLTHAERDAAVVALYRLGYGDRTIAERVGNSERTVARIRQRLGLPGLAWREQQVGA